jgi:hypothetical protein
MISFKINYLRRAHIVLKLVQHKGGPKKMLIPSTLVLLIGVLSIAVLAATDWYLWGLNLTANPRQPRHPVPLTAFELIDLGLQRLIAVNQAVLPRAALETARANSAPVATNPDDGFKRVA